MKLLLAADLQAQIFSEAKAAAPRECCGLVLGRRTEAGAIAHALHPTRNMAERADRFEIDPADHFAALKAARAAGLDVVGCYHSHPDGVAQPSATDLAGAGEQGFFWLIAAGATLAAFVYSSGSFDGADLVTSSS